MTDKMPDEIYVVRDSHPRLLDTVPCLGSDEKDDGDTKYISEQKHLEKIDSIGVAAVRGLNKLKAEHAEEIAALKAEHRAEMAGLFDGFAVYSELDYKARSRTSTDNVSDVLDAVVRLIKRQGSEESV